MDATFLTQRRDATLAQITAYEAAALALNSGVEEYSLDTGQSRQTVRRVDLAKINAVLDSLYQRYNNFCNLLQGARGTIAGPDW